MTLKTIGIIALGIAVLILIAGICLLLWGLFSARSFGKEQDEVRGINRKPTKPKDLQSPDS